MTKKEMVEELKNANWIGEDGNMATISSSKLGAWRKFKKEMEDVQVDTGVLDTDREWENNIHLGWAYLATEKEKREFNDGEINWYVSYKQPKINGVAGVKVWVLNY